jgi:hypothetical protein
MSNKQHKNKSTVNFVLVNPQHINVRNPVTTETIRSQQEEIKHDPLFTEKSCNPLLATMQNKDDLSSYI